MQSTIIFAFASAACVFALVSWSITAHLLPYYQFLAKDYSTNYDWGPSWGSDWGYKYAFAYTGGYNNYGYTSSGLKAPLAVSAVGMAIGILLFLFAPSLAFYAWKEGQDAGIIPRWLNWTVLGLGSAGFAIGIAQFGVFGHYNMMLGEVAAQAVMFFLASLLGIAASSPMPRHVFRRRSELNAQNKEFQAHANATCPPNAAAQV